MPRIGEKDYPGQLSWQEELDLEAMHPVTEAERSVIMARDRFRRVTQAALEQFQKSVIDSRLCTGLQEELLVAACAEAAREYFSDAGIKPPFPDTAELTCEDE